MRFWLENCGVITIGEETYGAALFVFVSVYFHWLVDC